MATAGYDGTGYGSRIVILNSPLDILVVDAFTTEPVSHGIRLANLELIDTCTEDGVSYRIYSGEVFTPGAGTAAFIAAPEGVTLSTDGEAIVKGDGDEDGSAEAVIVRQGGPAVHTTLWSDLPLLAGDRICDFEELWTDDDTGETYYFAYVEW